MAKVFLKLSQIQPPFPSTPPHPTQEVVIKMFGTNVLKK